MSDEYAVNDAAFAIRTGYQVVLVDAATGSTRPVGRGGEASPLFDTIDAAVSDLEKNWRRSVPAATGTHLAVQEVETVLIHGTVRQIRDEDRPTLRPQPSESRGAGARIAEIRQRWSASTPPPWIATGEVDGYRHGRRTVVSATDPATGKRARVVTVDQTRRHIEPAEKNVEFIVHAHADVRDLLDVIEKVRSVRIEDKHRALGLNFEAGMAHALALVHQALNDELEPATDPRAGGR